MRSRKVTPKYAHTLGADIRGRNGLYSEDVAGSHSNAVIQQGSP